MATYLTRTPSSAGNRKTWTFSAWIKRTGSLTANQTIFHGSPANPTTTIRFGSESASDGKLNFYHYSGSFTTQVVTNREFRDTNGWYHIVASVDTTQGTEANRVKLYVNGVQETSLMTATYPSQNFDFSINNNTAQVIGATSSGGDSFSGSMSHVHFIDGTAYDPTVFGSTDATTGEWKINTSPSVTYGNNGFFILKDGNSVTDQSGNGNNFTVGGGTLTKTEDCPSNVFCVWNVNNVAAGNQAAPPMTNGATGVSGAGQAVGTIGDFLSRNKKYYYEFKGTDIDGSDSEAVGWSTEISAQSGSWAAHNTLFLYGSSGKIYGTSGWTGVVAPTWTNGDIIGCSVDCSSNEIKWYKNDSLAYTISSISFDGDLIFPHAQWQSSSAGVANFGNGSFGTSSISSAGTNASSIGLFEYDVKPTDATALSTKGLNL